MNNNEYVRVQMNPKLINLDVPQGKRSFTTKHQVTGWRFLLHRTARSITEGTVSPHVEPLLTYNRMFTLGLVLTCLILIVSFIYSLINPAGLARDNSIVEDKDSRSFFVITDNVLHPVFNLTSARLVLGQPLRPITVQSQELTKFALGEKIGIPDAPTRIIVNSSDQGEWVVCDHNSEVTVYHPKANFQPMPTSEHNGMIVSNRGRYWLLWDHYRSRLFHINPEVLHTLGLENPLLQAPSISDQFLNTIQEQGKRGVYTLPRVPGYGKKVNFPLTSFPLMEKYLRVGKIIIDRSVQPARYFMAEINGVQEIPATLASLFFSRHPRAIYHLHSPLTLYAVPRSNDIDISQYPSHDLVDLNKIHQPYLCMRWYQPNSDTPPIQTLFVTSELPQGKKVHHQLPMVDTLFDDLDGHIVQLADSPLQGATFWLSSLGVVYGLPEESFRALGIKDKPVLIPWSVLALYSKGLALSKTNALSTYIERGAN